MAPSTEVGDRSNDLWARAVKELSDNDKRITDDDIYSSDRLQILNDVHAAAMNSMQQNEEARWKYTRKNGKVVILRDVFGKIVGWVDVFKDVGDVAVQHDPAHAALPWAGIRFILQIAINDFKKRASVIADLEEISECICKFVLVEKLYLQGTSEAVKELEKGVVKLYASILSFLSKAIRYLEQGTLTTCMLSTIWTIIDSRSEKTIKSTFASESDLRTGLGDARQAEKEVEACMRLVDRQDNIDRYAQVLRAMAGAENILNDVQGGLKDAERAKILEWLSPEPYMQHHQQYHQDFLDGTGQWLLSDPVFRDWRGDTDSSILLLHGILGSGKSTLVSLVIEKALVDYKSDPRSKMVFFYCSRNPLEHTRSKPQAILASLARQLSCAEPGKPLLAPAVQLFKERQMNGFASASLTMEESLKLILQLTPFYDSITIVIDALDACNPQERPGLLRALEDIIRRSTSPVKIFISSRTDQDVSHLPHCLKLEIDAQRNSDDIARVVKGQIEKLVASGTLLNESDSVEDMKEFIEAKVIEGAGGMFRWASMQLKYLCSFKSDYDIKNSLGRLPPDLNTLYDEIYDIVSIPPCRNEAAIFKNAICWLLCARTRLRAQEFLHVVSFNLQSDRNEAVVSIGRVLEICNNFVVYDHQLETFRFAHWSVQEYLKQKVEFNSSETNALTAEVCLHNVLSADSNFSSRKLLWNLGLHAHSSQYDFEELRKYADAQWPHHCRGAEHKRKSGNLKPILQHVFGLGGTNTNSALVHWIKRIQKSRGIHLDWFGRLNLRDSVGDLDSDLSIRLLASCAFDFSELLEDILKDPAIPLQITPKSCQNLLNVALINRSRACIRILLGSDQLMATRTPSNTFTAYLLNRVQKICQLVTPAALSWIFDTMAQPPDLHGDNAVIWEEAVFMTARNLNNDKEAMTLLLDRYGDTIPITERILELLVGSENGKDIMTLLLARRRDEVVITGGLFTSALRNYKSGHEILALLHAQRSNVRFAEDCEDLHEALHVASTLDL